MKQITDVFEYCKIEVISKIVLLMESIISLSDEWRSIL